MRRSSWHNMLFFAGSVFLIVAAVSAGVLTAHAVSPSKLPETRLSITAEGRVTASPDVGRVVIGILTEGSDSKNVSDINARKVNEIVNFFKREGVSEQDIKTLQFSLQPQYYYPYQYPNLPCPEFSASGDAVACPPDKPVVIGYILSQSISLKIRNLERAGEFIAGAADRGANNIGALSFSIEDIDAYKKEARELAFLKAEAQAHDLARFGKFEIEKVASIQEEYVSSPRPYFGAGRVGAMAAPSAPSTPPQIESGAQDIVVTLTVTFKIR